MPTYEVELKNGRTLHIDADDQNAALAGAQHFLSQPQPSARGQVLPPMPDGYQLEQPAQRLPAIPDGFQLETPQTPTSTADAPVTTAGLAKAAGAGAVAGTVGVPGDVVSLINLARRGYSKLAGEKYDPERDDWSLGQTYEHIRQGAEDLYKPQNTAESIAKGAGEFAPAILAGPEQLAGKGASKVAGILAKRAVTQAAVPYVASEAAGKATEGTELEPYARVGAALLAGGLTTRNKPASVSLDAARAETNASYNAARNSGVTYDPTKLATDASALKTSLSKRGISAASAPSVHDTLDSFVNASAPVSLTDLEEQRQLLGELAGKGGKEGLAARASQDMIDNVMSNPSNAVAGSNPADAYNILRQARLKALATRQIKDIEGLESDAATHTAVHGVEQNKALQMRFGQAVRNDSFMQPFNDPDLVSRMRDITEGSFPQGIAKRLGGGDLSKWRALELGALVAPGLAPGVVAGRGLGYALSGIADARTMAKVAKLKTAIAQQAGLPVTPARSAWRARLLAALGAQTNSNAAQ